MAGSLAPVHAPCTAGEVFDFGTHANDFLLRREQALATETFTVRVPGGGAVPRHVHTDMEQTFVFISGVGEAILDRAGDVRGHTCRPGDTLFVPTGWHHTVVAASPQGAVYVTVNAFVADADRIGASATEHALLAAQAFCTNTPHGILDDHGAPLREPDAAALLRCAEALLRPDAAGVRMWSADFTALDATLLREPAGYRVRRLGPFDYVADATPVPRVLDTALADRLHQAVAGRLPAYVEGSQSPLSVKPPCADSDLDLLLLAASAADLETAREVVADLRALQSEIGVPLSPGVVHPGWLALPAFYSALSLDPGAPDRTWWRATDAQRLAEAARRQREALQALDPGRLLDLLHRSLDVAGATGTRVQEWRLTPRWRGYL
ncbi:MAG: cupin domain-containing protein [Pseudonocardiaceae bacterium]